MHPPSEFFLFYCFSRERICKPIRSEPQDLSERVTTMFFPTAFILMAMAITGDSPEVKTPDEMPKVDNKSCIQTGAGVGRVVRFKGKFKHWKPTYEASFVIYDHNGNRIRGDADFNNHGFGNNRKDGTIEWTSRELPLQKGIDIIVIVSTSNPVRREIQKTRSGSWRGFRRCLKIPLPVGRVSLQGLGLTRPQK